METGCWAFPVAIIRFCQPRDSLPIETRAHMGFVAGLHSVASRWLGPSENQVGSHVIARSALIRSGVKRVPIVFLLLHTPPQGDRKKTCA